MRKHLLALVVILTVATGCDNVAWGGIDVQLKGPPDAEEAPDAPVLVVTEDSLTKVPGPVLLAGTRDGSRADMAVVGEVLPTGLAPFPDPRFPSDADRMSGLSAAGAEWILFSEGARVGRLIVDASRPADTYCGPRVLLSGPIELLPAAAAATRFLALPAESARSTPHGAYATLEHTYPQRVGTLTIAGEAIPRNGASWPAGGVLEIRRHIQSFQPIESPGAWIAATFVNQDRLAVASPGPGAYALFVLGRPADGDYVEAFTWFRSVESEGKGAPRYHDHLDWDDDGESEVLLDVFGTNRRWFAALERRGGQWTRSFEDSCAGSTATAGPTASN